MKIRMRDGTGSVDLRFLTEDMDRHGNVRLYVRRKGRPKVRLHETPGTDAFMAEYRAALDGTPAPPATSPGIAPPGSLRWLVQRYVASAAFMALGAGTRRVRRGILEGICDSVEAGHQVPRGDKRFAKMLPRHVARIRDEKADLPEAANARVKALRQMFKWATSVEQALAEKDPTIGVRYLRPNNPGGHHTWTVEQVYRYQDRHAVGTMARLAIEIFLCTGVRRSDAIRLGRQFERAGELHFTEHKGRARTPKRRVLPILPQLRAAIDAAPAGNLTYLITAFGRPFTDNGFGNRFRKWCDEAGLPAECTAHGIRKSGAVIAVGNGVNAHDLMAIYGWETLKEAERYTRDADRVAAVKRSLHRIVPERKSNASVPLSGVVASGGTIRAKKP